MRTVEFEVAAIETGDRLRNIDPARVDALADSIRQVGLLSPIAVWMRDDVTAVLAFGAHRLAALKKLGVEITAAQVIGGTDLDRQLAEIDENLIRAELSPTERAEHEAKRKELWEAKQQQAEQVVPPVDVAKHGHAQADGFATETAAVTGESKQNVNRNVRRGKGVCKDAMNLLRGTAADTGTNLDALVMLKRPNGTPDHDAQVHAANDMLARARARAQKSSSDARELRRRAAEKQASIDDAYITMLRDALWETNWRALREYLDAGHSITSVTIAAFAKRHPDERV